MENSWLVGWNCFVPEYFGTHRSLQNSLFFINSHIRLWVLVGLHVAKVLSLPTYSDTHYRTHLGWQDPIQQTNCCVGCTVFVNGVGVCHASHLSLSFTSHCFYHCLSLQQETAWHTAHLIPHDQTLTHSTDSAKSFMRHSGIIVFIIAIHLL